MSKKHQIKIKSKKHRTLEQRKWRRQAREDVRRYGRIGRRV